MKDLKNTILEKLHINKNTKSLLTYTFGEYADLAKDCIGEKINRNQFESTWGSWLEDGIIGIAIFIDISDDEEEMNYYKRCVANYNKEKFESYYAQTFRPDNSYGDKGYFIAYLTDYGHLRVGFVINQEYKNLDKVKIFKILSKDET